MYIRDECVGTQRVITVIPNDNITRYFVECLENGQTDGYIMTYTLVNVMDVLRATYRGTTNSSAHYKGHWFYDYESVCRWINEHCDADENVVEENY